MPLETDAGKIARLERKIEQLQRENERLRRQLEEALRAVKRQAAPFSRRFPKAHRQPPGRKAGADYGSKAHRAVPAVLEQTFEAGLPVRCPPCGGRVVETGVVEQYQTEIPEPQVERIRFRVHVGRCRRCARRLQGGHPRQSSNATGSAASQLGPRAVALATQLNKGLGLPYGKTAAVLEQAFGLAVTRGGLCQAIARVGRRAEPSYQRLVEQVRASPSVTPDETGWKVGGRRWWLWVLATPQATVYAIRPRRGFEQATAVLGENFAGFLVRDGWAVYRRFAQAVHQTCLAHLLRRCREMVELARPDGAAARFPQAVKGILQGALALRHRLDHGEISEAGLAVAHGRLEARLDRALGRRYRSAGNQRLANRLDRQREAIFPYLILSGSGGHQLACRAGAAPGGGGAQGLGRQPHRAGGRKRSRSWSACSPLVGNEITPFKLSSSDCSALLSCARWTSAPPIGRPLASTLPAVRSQTQQLVSAARAVFSQGAKQVRLAMTDAAQCELASSMHHRNCSRKLASFSTFSTPMLCRGALALRARGRAAIELGSMGTQAVCRAGSAHCARELLR